MKNIITFTSLLFFIFLALHAQDESSLILTSSYTSIEQKDCITLDSDNMGSVQECESFTNIGVKVIEGDMRQSIILRRNKKEYDLAFSSIVSPTFSSLGLQIEWRHEIGKPENVKGMIVRLESSDNENLDRTSSYLIVSKITSSEMCVIAKVVPQHNQNVIARAVLDTKLERPCLKELRKKEK